jgi:hypothetical protein
LTFTREDYSLKYIAGLSAHFCEDFKVRFMHEEDDVETDKRLLELFDIHEYPSFFIVQRIENKIHIEKYDGKINFPDMVKFFGSFVESDNGEEQGTLKEKMEKEGLPATIPIDAHNYEYFIFQEYHSVLLHFTDGVHNMESWDYIQYRYRGMFKFAEINC